MMHTTALTLEHFTLSQRFPAGIGEVTPAGDGSSYYVMSDDGGSIHRLAFATGDTVATVMDARAMSLPVRAFDGYKVNEAGSKVLLWAEREPIYRNSFRAFYYVLDLKSGVLQSLGDDKQEIAVISPDGTQVAYVVDCNVMVRDLATGDATAVTTDGLATDVTNGVPDWVYQEEFGILSSLRWSADSGTLAFIRWNEAAVPMTWVTLYQGACSPRTDNALYPSRLDFKYPVAGQVNSTVTLHAWHRSSRLTVRLDVPLDADGYIPQLDFAPSGKLMVSTLNRLQNHWQIYAIDVENNHSQRVYDETSATWLLTSIAGGPRYYDDAMVLTSDRDGYARLYTMLPDGTQMRALSPAGEEVTAFYGRDVKRGKYYYQRTDGPLNRVVAMCDKRGRESLLSVAGRTASATFSSDFSHYIERVSDAATPDVYSVRDARGRVVRVVQDNADYRERYAGVPQRRLFTIVTERGDSLNAYIIVPSDFDAGHRYPVIMSQYSGPGSQEVLNRWEIDWENYAATQGYVVVCVDPRGTGARGKAWRGQVYRHMGKLETEDHLSAARYVAAQPWCDAARMAIYGWSYGGFEALMAMSQGEDSPYSAGVSIAPVTSWRFYDTIYTERFMGLPDDNAAGYDYSPLGLIDGLRGRLMLIFGSADDNVQIVNEMEFIAQLNDRGRDFDLMVYPNMNHSINGCDVRLTLYRRVMQFLDTALNVQR